MQEPLDTKSPGFAALDRFEQLPRLQQMMEEVLATNPFWRQRLDKDTIPRCAEDYQRLPFTSNRDLSEDLLSTPPFGSNLTYPIETYTRLHQTSGTKYQPLRVLDTATSWDWWCDCWDAVLDVSGVTSSDRAMFAFSFAPFIGFWSAHAAMARRNALVISGGGASTVRRLHMLVETGCTVLFCTPTYALHLAEVADREGVHIKGSGIRCTILAGEPGGSVPAMRRRIQEAWQAEVFDHAGMSEVGAYGIPCPEGRGVFVNEREFIAEVIDIESRQPVSKGQTGELVLTNLGRWGNPVIRFRTGDLVQPQRLEEGLLLQGGILGRIDQMLVIRGVNLHSSSIEQVVRNIAGNVEYRVTLSRKGALDEAEIEVEAQPETCSDIGLEIQNSFGIRVRVSSVRLGSLPRWEAKAQRFHDLRKSLHDSSTGYSRYQGC